MASERFTFQRGLFERIVLGVVAFPVLLVAAWLPTWSVDVRCDRVQPSRVECTTRSHGFMTDSAEHVVVEQPRGARKVMTPSKKKRGSPSASLVFDTPGGEVSLPVSNLSAVTRANVDELTQQLDRLARGSADHVSTTLRLDPMNLVFVFMVVAVMALVLWIQGHRVDVEFDGDAATVTITHRHFGIRTEQVRVKLSDITGVHTVRQKRTTSIALATRERKLDIWDAGHTKAAEHVATLERALRRLSSSPST